ncbi:hypothetical protein Ddye_017715 [Dipteronia dyeriana]|uniref:RNase H type-1 domain-containing protein n=1 Tax=Dipteronia dyeriana TaxID=168575 RepID=A0AAD9U9Q8_9ROSI|nr:hypothetical protein Ddye_017715 [Dipteronia dyeriana]
MPDFSPFPEFEGPRIEQVLEKEKKYKSDIFVLHMKKVTKEVGTCWAVSNYCSKAFKWTKSGGYGTYRKHIMKHHLVEHTRANLLKEGIWLIGENSQRDFWHDNWLGVPILELLGILDYLATLLKARVSDFIYEAVALWEAIFSAFQRRISIDTWSSFFSQAMSVSFSDQMRVLWKSTIHDVVWSVWLARNQWIFESKTMYFGSALSFVWRAVSDANRLEIGCMRNCIDDLLILHRFDLCGIQARAHVIRSVIWSPPAPGWTKVNIDGAALSSPGAGGCGGIFHNFRAFVKGCFAVPLDHVFAFEAELLAASIAINFAWQNGWHQIWLKSDSSYVVQLLSYRSEQVP